MRVAALLLLCLCVAAGLAHARDSAESRILVTFADPGLSNAARAGPARPGYGNRTSTYLVSVNIRRAADRLADDFGLTVVDEWPIVPLNVHCLVYAVGNIDNDADVEQLLAELRTRPEVESAQRMNEFEVLAPAAGTDPYSRLQHNVYTLELLQAHAWSRGDGSRVTIIDTGADIRHPDLESQVDEHVDFVSADDREFVADAHGTAVAGIIGAASDNGVGMIGIAPSARLSVLKACWYAEQRDAAVCNSFTLAKAISHAIESAPQVINLSLGGPADPLLARLLALALDNGSVVVAAEQPGSSSGFPAGVPGVIVVGASTTASRAAPRVVAPGEEILVPVPGGGYDYASGSSLSAAHVSGIAALLVAREPGLTGADVSELLVASRAGDSVNACRALASLLQVSGCRGDDAAAQNAPEGWWLEAGGETHDEL